MLPRTIVIPRERGRVWLLTMSLVSVTIHYVGMEWKRHCNQSNFKILKECRLSSIPESHFLYWKQKACKTVWPCPCCLHSATIPIISIILLYSLYSYIGFWFREFVCCVVKSKLKPLQLSPLHVMKHSIFHQQL